MITYIGFISFILILSLSFLNYLIYRRKKDSYLKAGKKWDKIVDELSRRK